MRVLVFMAFLQTCATQKVNTSNFILTTPVNLSRKTTPQELPPSHFNPNLSHYDWSISAERYLENPRYDYKDFWWVTIRDSYKFFSDPPATTTTTEHNKIFEKHPVHTTTTKHVTESTIPVNKTGPKQDVTESTKNHKANNESVRLKSYISRMGKNIPNSQNLHSIIDKDVSKIEYPSYIDRVKANAVNRNKQIQRMFEELAPPPPPSYVVIAAPTPATPGVKFDAIARLFGLNRDLNITYNKIVENFQLNVGENNVQNLFDLGVTYHPTVMASKVSEVGETKTINRQGPPQMTTSESATKAPNPGPTWRQEYWWGTTTARPANLMQDLKNEVSLARSGYFSVFVSQCALIIGEKPDKEVRLLALALEKEYHVLYNQEKYILSFGQPFLTAFEAFTTKVANLPPDYLKHRAMLLYFALQNKRERLTDELNSIIDYIDKLFKEEEGLALFRVVELLNNYPNTKENSYEVLRAMSAAVFAPYRRLSGSDEIQILTESINDYLRIFDTHLKSNNETEFEHFSHKQHVLRRFINKTRFAVVTRDNKIKSKVKSKNNRLKKTTKRMTNCFSRSCRDRINTKYKEVNEITHITKAKDLTYVTNYSNGRKIISKKHTVTRFPSTKKYPTTRQKNHSRDDVVRKHRKTKTSHHNKNIKIKKDVHEKSKERDLLREFKKTYYDKYQTFVKMNGHDKISNIKSRELDKNRNSNLSDTDVSVSDETEDSSDYDTDDSVVSAEKTTSKIELSRAKKSNSSKNGKIAKSMNKLIATNVTERNQVQFISSANTSNQTTEILRRNGIKRKQVKKILNIKEYKNVNELRNKKIKTVFHNEEYARSNEKYMYINQERTVKPTDRNTIVTVKNKITDLTSYSDEEDLLKFKISDAMRHGEEYFNPMRRSYHVTDNIKKGINEFTSYSSEEVILKSNIYKTLGFEKFNITNKAFRRADDNDLRVKKIRFQKFKPVNEMSSYSDEESILREKLYK